MTKTLKNILIGSLILIKNNKFTYCIVAILLSLFLFFCFSFGYQISDRIICNIIETNNKQTICFQSNKNKQNFISDQKINLIYDNKNVWSTIENIYVDNGITYIEIDKYIFINNNNFNLYIKLENQPLIFIVLKNIF